MTIKEQIKEQLNKAREKQKQELRIPLHKLMLECADRGDKTLVVHDLDDLRKEILEEDGFEWEYHFVEPSIDQRERPWWTIYLTDEKRAHQ